MVAHGHGNTEPNKTTTSTAGKSAEHAVSADAGDAPPLNLDPALMASADVSTPAFLHIFKTVPKEESAPGQRYPWRNQIVTTTFWVGEKPTKNNPVPNSASAWDQHWAKHYGGTDTPDKADRHHYIPVKFTPQQNPFYIALPFNDMSHGKLKPEDEHIIPWFKKMYRAPNKSVCKDRWIAIRYKGRVCYAQWEDAGPFRTDNSEYVFGHARPKPNLNRGAGLDVSPAVRDYLGMNSSDVTDWRFVEFSEVPKGPWALYGNNNTFVMNARKSDSDVKVAENQKRHAEKVLRE